MSTSSDLTLSIAQLSGQLSVLDKVKIAVDQVSYKLASMQSVATASMAEATSKLQGMAGYRSVSTVDDASNAERTAGQIAVVNLIKQVPDTTLETAIATWEQAAIAVRPEGRKWLLHNTNSLLSEYEANLGFTTWEDFRQWIIDTPVEQMGI